VRNQPKDAVADTIASLYPGQNKEQPVFPFSPVVVNTGSSLVVIDSGTGEADRQLWIVR
jgi:hypothetical protein